MSPIVSPAGLHSSPNRFSNGLARKIGSGEAAPIRIPGAAPWGAASSSLTGATGGHVVERRSDVTASFILHLTKRDQLGGDSLRDGAQRLPCGFAHVLEHGASHAREVVKACREFGNVCRA